MLLLPSEVAQEEEEDLEEEEEKAEEEQRAACQIGDAGAKVRLSVIHAGALKQPLTQCCHANRVYKFFPSHSPCQ
jgi:hypothetical protein